MKNSLRGSEVNNDPLKAKVVVPAAFLPSAQVVVKKQDSSFQNWEVSRTPKIYSAVVEYKARKFSKQIYIPGK